HRLHDAGLPRQVHAVHGRAPRQQALVGRVGGLRQPDADPAELHQRDGQQGAEVAASRSRPDVRLSAHQLLRGRRMSSVRQPATGKRNLVDMSWDPITRIVGSLGIFTKIDFDNREVAECYSTSSIFRGYSVFMKGKDPRDAHFITSRICGICGDNHATCSMYAQNMAFGVRPPNLVEWIVNLGEAAEYMFDHNIFQDNLVGVDFCEQMVKATNPSVWAKAQKTDAPNAALHGYRTIADIMTALNPFTG